jgi:hypothetical protein
LRDAADDGWLVIGQAPEPWVVGRSRRAPATTPRARRLGDVDRAAIRLAHASGRSLRLLAADHGVSHQTISNVVHEAKPATAAMAAD